ncbi:MAG: hypothetical protein ABI182_00295 [Candidatus Baltobacteraceae bacterium]
MSGLLIAAAPTTARVDANARAEGNRLPIAVKIGSVLFASKWPAQVLKVYAYGVREHDIVGLRVSGVKFHTPLSRAGFSREIASLVTQSFAVAPIEEIDVSAVVPLAVGKDIVVAGDLAKPTSRTVFTITVRQGESEAELLARMRSGRGVYWDQEWAKAALH